ncbi:hypothetical protein D9M71_230430 [compost metagenome]
MADHARQHQPSLGNHALFLEVAAVKFGVGQNGLARDFVEGNVLRRELGRRGNGQAVTNPVRVADGPLQGLHAAQATPDHRSPLVDAQGIGQACLAVDPVFDRQYREFGAEGFACGRVDAAGAGRTVATAQVVQADHEELVGVDRLARADAAVPPTGLAIIDAVVASRMVVAGQGVTNEHGVAGTGIERAVGFEHQVIGRDRTTAGQGQWFAEVCQLRCDQTYRIGGKDSGHRPCSRLNEA